MRVAVLLRSRHRIFALTRDAERCAALRDHGLTPLTGDLDRGRRIAAELGVLSHQVIQRPAAVGSTAGG